MFCSFLFCMNNLRSEFEKDVLAIHRQWQWRLKNDRRNSILMTCHYLDLGSASDWMKQIFNQLELPARTGWWRVISMEFLRSLLRRHSVVKLMVESRNVGCFLKSHHVTFSWENSATRTKGYSPGQGGERLNVTWCYMLHNRSYLESEAFLLVWLPLQCVLQHQNK